MAPKGEFTTEITGKPCPMVGLNNTYTGDVSDLFWKEDCPLWNLLFWELSEQDAFVIGIVCCATLELTIDSRAQLS